jgi:hypothetical protein
MFSLNFFNVVIKLCILYYFKQLHLFKCAYTSSNLNMKAANKFRVNVAQLGAIVTNKSN